MLLNLARIHNKQLQHTVFQLKTLVFSIMKRSCCVTVPFFTKTIILYVTAKPRKKSRKKLLPRVPDHTHLACGHHRAIVASLSFVSFLRKQERGRMLVVGLGGGALPAYIHKHFPTVRILICSSHYYTCSSFE